MDSRNSIVDALAVHNDIILGVGSVEELAPFIEEQTQKIDLCQKTMLPGFFDAHSHFMRAGMYDKYFVNIFARPIGDMESHEDILKKLKEVADKTPKGEWILGIGYDDTALQEKRHFTLEEIDALLPDHPVFLRHISGHSAFCNSLALKLAHVDENTPNPPGSVYCKDKDGQLTGLVEEPTAMEHILSFAPPMNEEKWLASLDHINNVYLEQGITTAHEGGTTTQMFNTYLSAQQKSLLKVRVQILPRVTGFDTSLVQSTQAGSQLGSDNMLSLGAMKLFQDGSIQAYTAYLSNPYHDVIADQISDKDEWRGYPIFDTLDFNERIKQYHKAGWQIAIHGNGDDAIEEIINAIELAQKEYPRNDARHIIIHCQTVRSDQLDRIKRLGIVPSFFVTHTYYWGDRHRDIFLGEERAKRISPLKSALTRKIPFSLHNDTPVTPISPLMSVWSAVNRITSSGEVLGEYQRISVIDALRSITYWSAYQFHEEDKKGSLEPQKWADMVILAENPLQVEKTRIKDIKVLTTIVGNKAVYGSLEFHT